MTDALSHCYLLLSDMRFDVPGFDVFHDLYASDPFFGPMLARLKHDSYDDYILVDGFLFKGLCLCVPMSSLRLKIIGELHSAGHVGRDRSIELV